MQAASVHRSRTWVRDNGPHLLVLALVILASVGTSRFLSLQNVRNVLTVGSFMGILAIGMMVTVLIGGIDLSVGSIYALTSLIYALSQHHGVGIGSYDKIQLLAPLPILFAMAVAAGIVLGLLNGALIALLRIPDFIATLGTLIIYGGLTFAITNTQPVYGVAPAARALGTGTVAGIPVPAIFWAFILVVTAVVLSRTRLGRHLYAVGINRRAALLSGVEIWKVQLAAYAFSGAMAGLAGALMAGWVNGGEPRIGESVLLPTIAAVVLGGVSLAGGRGSVVGTASGVLTLTLIANILNLLGVPPFPQQVVTGLVIIVALMLQGTGSGRESA